MAIVKIPQLARTLILPLQIQYYLGDLGVEYSSWPLKSGVLPQSSPEQIFEAYASEIADLEARYGYAIVELIDVGPETPGLDMMLERFRVEHFHQEDEVQFVLAGRGICHVRPASGPVVAIEEEPGDFLRIPGGLCHWFDLCADRRMRAIRFFKSSDGWVPRYTGSGAETDYEPVCFGPAYFPHLRRGP